MATPEHAFAWDGAGRLTGADDATLSYNGLGQARTRAEGAAATRFHYNQAIALAPPVAEQAEAGGQFLRYYVWTPEGRLLYLIDAPAGNAVRFYHCDQVGSTLALTDAAGEVADAYAYDPYGGLLKHEGTSLQPFTFAGAWGVRREGEGGLYQMRARYYDASAGRFLSPEPLWPRLLDPRALNPYPYANGDPLRLIDPMGLTSFLVQLMQKLLECETPLGPDEMDWRPGDPPHSGAAQLWKDKELGARDSAAWDRMPERWNADERRQIQQIQRWVDMLKQEVRRGILERRREKAMEEAKRADVQRGSLKYQPGMVAGLWFRLGDGKWVFFANARAVYRDKFRGRILIHVPVAVPGEKNRINVLGPDVLGHEPLLSDDEAPAAAWVEVGFEGVDIWMNDFQEVWEGWAAPE